MNAIDTSVLTPAQKKILFVVGSLEVGGAERHLTQVALRLKQRGWAPEVFALIPGGPLTNQLHEGDVRVRSASPPVWIERFIRNERLRARIGLVITSWALLKSLLGTRPQVLHFFLPAAYIVGGLVSMLARPPVRIMSRRSLRNYQAAHYRLARIERWLHPRMTLICGNSKAVVAELAEEGVTPHALRLIYNGVDLEAFRQPFDRAEARAQESLAPETLVFVMVANLIPYKGHADLIDAFAGIRDAIDGPWTVLVVGRDDGIGAELHALANGLGVGENIRFLGSRSDVPALLRLADIGVLCSHQEGFSNAVIEGMAAGLPMVVTDVGGNAEAVVHMDTGLVVPARNPALLGQALLAMARNRQRHVMGERGRQRVEALFDMEACVTHYEAMYRDALCAG